MRRVFASPWACGGGRDGRHDSFLPASESAHPARPPFSPAATTPAGAPNPPQPAGTLTHSLASRPVQCLSILGGSTRLAVSAARHCRRAIGGCAPLASPLPTSPPLWPGRAASSAVYWSLDRCHLAPALLRAATASQGRAGRPARFGSAVGPVGSPRLYAFGTLSGGRPGRLAACQSTSSNATCAAFCGLVDRSLEVNFTYALLVPPSLARIPRRCPICRGVYMHTLISTVLALLALPGPSSTLRVWVGAVLSPFFFFLCREQLCPAAPFSLPSSVGE